MTLKRQGTKVQSYAINHPPKPRWKLGLMAGLLLNLYNAGYAALFIIQMTCLEHYKYVEEHSKTLRNRPRGFGLWATQLLFYLAKTPECALVWRTTMLQRTWYSPGKPCGTATVGTYIFNFGFGVFLFAFGVGRGTLLGMTSGHIWCIVGGLAVVGLALLGYLGAVKLNRKMLHAYSWLTIGCAALEVTHLAILSCDLPSLLANNLWVQAFFIAMICFIVIATTSVLLACTLSLQILRHGSGTATGYRQ